MHTCSDESGNGLRLYIPDPYFHKHSIFDRLMHWIHSWIG